METSSHRHLEPMSVKAPLARTLPNSLIVNCLTPPVDASLVVRCLQDAADHHGPIADINKDLASRRAPSSRAYPPRFWCSHERGPICGCSSDTLSTGEPTPPAPPSCHARTLGAHRAPTRPWAVPGRLAGRLMGRGRPSAPVRRFSLGPV
jgi:hypothetical protein